MLRNKDAEEGRAPSRPRELPPPPPVLDGQVTPMHRSSVHKGTREGGCVSAFSRTQMSGETDSGGKRHVSTHILSILKETAVGSQDSSTDEACFYQCISIKLHTLGIHIIQGSSLNAGLGRGQRTSLTPSQMMAMPLVQGPQFE